MIQKHETWDVPSADPMEVEKDGPGSAMTDESGSKGDPKEELQITFLYMGQGDCVLISCPDRKRIMVDCGSSASFNIVEQARARQHLRSDDGAGKSGNKLHALILTHPDADHYNQIPKMLCALTQDAANEWNGRLEAEWKRRHGDTALKTTEERQELHDELERLRLRATGDIGIDHVYFSSHSPLHGDAKPLGMYHQSSTDASVYGLAPETINLVTINNTAKKLCKWTCKDRSPVKVSESDIPKERRSMETITVASGTTPKGKVWSVEIIAGGVSKNGDHRSDREESNAGSLVTLLEFGSEKALLCGDATVTTEEFLLRPERKALIQKVSVLQAPHHGSSTSSCERFVDATAPETVVVSVELIDYRHHLPTKGVIQRYLAKVQELDENDYHWVDWWWCDPEAKDTAHELLETWRSQRKQFEERDSTGGTTEPGGPHYILNAEQQQQKGWIALSPNTGHMLCRTWTRQDLSLTGLSQKVYLNYGLNDKKKPGDSPLPSSEAP